MLFKFRLIIFYKKYILNLPSNCNLTNSNNYNIKTRKSCKNPIKLPNINTEKGKRSMFYTAAYHFGELAWDLQDLYPDTFKEELATRLWAAG